MENPPLEQPWKKFVLQAQPTKTRSTAPSVSNRKDTATPAAEQGEIRQKLPTSTSG